MALARTDLTAVTQIGMASTQAIVTVSAGQTCYVKSIIIHNCSSTAINNANIYVVPNSGGSAGTANTTNQIFNVDVYAGETVFLEPSYPIVIDATGDTVQVGTGLTTINFLLTGDKEA